MADVNYNAFASRIDEVARRAQQSDGGGRGGDGVESRLSALEAHMTHVVDDVREIKTDVRSLSGKVDTNLRWLLTAYAAGIAAVLGVMAKGFGWL